MSENPLPRHAARLLNRVRRLQALTLASVQIARDRIEELQDRKDSEGNQIVDIEGRLDRLQRWLQRAHNLLMWLDQQSHEVGVLVQKIELGITDPDSEPVRRLSQLMGKKHQAVAEAAVEHLGRGSYKRAEELGAELLISSDADHEQVETTDEFERLMEEVTDPDEPVVESTENSTESTTDETAHQQETTRRL